MADIIIFLPLHVNVTEDWLLPKSDFLAVSLMTVGAGMATPVLLNLWPYGIN
jgi:hypothetical protein